MPDLDVTTAPVLTDDTIIALATPAAAAARAVVRTSGPAAFDLAASLGATELADRAAAPVTLDLRGSPVPATCYAFRGPRSHTGQDVVEYHVPGSPVVVRMLLEALRAKGARDAGPGEFSARAFFNGKSDLAAVESVAAAIGATNDRELAAARRLGSGELATRLAPILDGLADTAALCELGIDFSEEDVEVLPPDEARRRIGELDAMLASLLTETTRFDRLVHEPTVALVGRPNAGKSTLLNALAGRSRATVSDVAGTTRDVLSAEIDLSAGRVVLLDCAGLEADDTTDIGRQMQTAARRAAREADVLVLVYAADDSRPPVDIGRPPDLIVRTRADLAPAEGLTVSATTGEGLDALREALADTAFAAAGGEALALGTRHVAAIEAARVALAHALDSVGGGEELLALHLRDALDHLGSILGTITPDDLLGRVFSRFCIGK